MQGDISLTDLRNCTQMILMECLVRRVKPDFFAGVLDNTVELLTALARIEAAAHVENALKLSEPQREPIVLRAAMMKIMPEIMDLRLKMSEKTMQMVECRDEPDSKVS